MSLLRRAAGRPRRVARAVGATRTLAVAVGVTAMAGAATTPAAIMSAAITSAAITSAPVTSTVASGSAQTLGEPAAAGDSAVSAVVATSFTSAGAEVVAWTRRAGSRTWREAGPVLPAGFGSSYDASAAALPGGPLLVVAGTSPGGSCIKDGSVAIADVYSGGKLGPARLVSDQRGTGRYDDRPVVAAGAGGMVWVAWSQGPGRDACQNVGVGDRLEVAVSHDGGHTFGAPVAMPADGGNSAFGARLVPLGGGRVAVSWMEKMSTGGDAVLVSVLGPGGQVSQPQQVLTGGTVPLILPGASFYDYPAGDITALPGGSLVVAAPLWRHGQAVIGVAAGTPGGQWSTSSVSPPSGADLLLPGLGSLTSDSARLVCVVHTRAGDRVGYYWADVVVSAQGKPSVPAALSPLTRSPSGPGYFEIGEELEISQTPSGLLSSMVVAGSGGAVLETKSWTVPRPPAPSPAGTPSHKRTGTTGRPDRTQTTRRAGAAASPASAWSSPATWTAVVFIVCAALLVAWIARRSRGPHGHRRVATASAHARRRHGERRETSR